MKEELTTIETSKLAQEKGFDIHIKEAYYETQEHTLEMGRGGDCTFPYHAPRVLNFRADDNHTKFVAYAPTQSLLQRWLREVHGIYVNSEHDLNPKGDGILYHTNWGFINVPTKEPRNTWYRVGGGYSENEEFKTYEEALEYGLQEGLRLINSADKK